MGSTNDLDVADFEIIGQLYVDSGLIMLVDPCYVLQSRGDLVEETYEDVLDAFHSGVNESPNHVEPWGTGLGTVVQTMYGDGSYPVYARKNERGQIAQVFIDFECFYAEVSEDE